jgi:hypothetical protein
LYIDVVMAICVCFKCMFQIFDLFQEYVAIDLYIAYICMLQAYVFKCFQVFHTYVLQVFYLDVAYICNGF